jgi:predicted small metal-binding protein
MRLQRAGNGGDYHTARKGGHMKKVIHCPCGSVIEGSNDEDVVKKAQDHAKTIHNMDLSREQALSMARPA